MSKEYSSRSEAEYAVLVMLINADFSFEEALEAFCNRQVEGKFKELHQKDSKNAVRWLQRSYDRAKSWAEQNESEPRRKSKLLIAWASNTPWTGRTGRSDRDVFIAHVRIMYRSGRESYGASTRELAELAGVSRYTASKATKRLIQRGLIKQFQPAVGDCPTQYRITLQEQNLTLPHNFEVREWQSLSNHDAFRWGGLTKSASVIYDVLLKQPYSVSELAEITSYHPKTIRRALRSMERLIDLNTGEIIRMVKKGDNGSWYGIEVDLDKVAEIVGTIGKGEQQRKQHMLERQQHQRVLARLAFRKSNKAE